MQRLVVALLIMGIVVPPKRTTDQQKGAPPPEFKASLPTLSSVSEDSDGLASMSDSLAIIRLQPIGYRSTIEISI